MGGLLGLMAAAGAGAFAYLVFWVRTRERARWWRAAADAVGLAEVRTSSVLGCETRLSGRAGPLRVTLATYQRGRHEQGTRVRIAGFRHGSYALAIRPEGVTSAIEKTFGERELELGDAAFDSVAYLQGSPALARAIFDRGTRRQMEALLRGALLAKGSGGARTLKVRASLSEDELQVEIPATLFNKTETWLPWALPVLVSMGHRLCRPADLAARIAANLRDEPLADVRLAGLRTLVSEFPDHSATRDALAAGLGDGDVEVRLLSAVALGAEGHPTLLELATGQATDRVAGAAIGALGDGLAVDTAVERLRQARRVRQEATARACVERLGRAGTPACVEALAEVVEAEDEDLAAAATRALGLARETGGIDGAGDTVERALVLALGHVASGVRVAAAEALGRVGTPFAVAPLREAMNGRALDGALRRATRQAIAEIQSRVSGASPGQLSLAGEGGGQLSLAEDDRSGQLSLGERGAARSPDGQPEADRARPQPGSTAAASFVPVGACPGAKTMGTPDGIPASGEAADAPADRTGDRGADGDAERQRARRAEAARQAGPMRES